MKSFSQSGQDIWVRLVLGEGFVGTFLDIGCAGEQFSNTLALEQSGWTGILIDIDDTAKGRKSKFIRADATKIDWTGLLPKYVDYLSLDIDFATLDALKSLPLTTTRFGIITIEDDRYRFGDKLWPEQARILKSFDYELICDKVCGTPDMPFETWHCSKELLPRAEKFRCSNKLWSDILK